MNDNVIDMLIYEDDEGLCSEYGLLPFQVDIFKKYYKRINSKFIRDDLCEKIRNGYYSSEEMIDSMAKTYISKAVMFSSDQGLDILINKCGLSEEDARKFTNALLHANKSINEMLSAELDVSNTNIRVDDMLETITKPFIDSQKTKSL